MCDQELLDLVKQVTAEVVKNQEEVTAYDINQMMHKLTSRDFFHNKVRRDIHREMQKYVDSGEYIKGNHPIYGAILYSPNLQKQNTVVPTAQTVEVSVKPYDGYFYGINIPSVSYAIIRTDKRGRLCLRKKHVKAAGIKFACNVFVDGRIMKPTLYNSTKLIAVYNVDKDGNIRISKSVLEKLGILDPNVKVSVYPDKIQLK